MPYLKAGDVISGQEGWASMLVHDASGDRVEDLFMVKNLEATAEIEKTDVYTLGKRGAQHKPNGWSGSGSMTVYYITSLFRKMVVQYIKTGQARVL